MHIAQFEEKTIRGLKTRTTNQDEMNPQKAKIGSLWQKFDKNLTVDFVNGERIYGVYYEYESDADGEFSVLAGYDGKNSDTTLEEVVLESGKYLLFEAVAPSADNSARIETIIATWGEVWNYFSKEPQYKRAYKTDFEHYKNPTEIAIYISVI